MVEAMQQLIQSGKTRYIGVSNFTRHHLQDMLDAGITVHYNQVEFHPHLYQKEILAFCHKQGMQLIAYRPLGKGKLVNEPLIHTIADAHNKKPAQVLLRWCMQKEVPLVVKAGGPIHRKENLDIFDVELTTKEMRILDHLSTSKRYCYPEWEDFSY